MGMLVQLGSANESGDKQAVRGFLQDVKQVSNASDIRFRSDWKRNFIWVISTMVYLTELTCYLCMAKKVLHGFTKMLLQIMQIKPRQTEEPIPLIQPKIFLPN